MMPDLQKYFEDEKYCGFQLSGRYYNTPEEILFRVDARLHRNILSFGEGTLITDPVLKIIKKKYKVADFDILENLCTLTFNKVKARIVLENYKRGVIYKEILDEKRIVFDGKKIEIRNETYGEYELNILQSRILLALRNIRILEPIDYEMCALSGSGICYLLDIDDQLFIEILDNLKTMKYIRHFKDIEKPGINNAVFITDKGLDYLKYMGNQKRG